MPAATPAPAPAEPAGSCDARVDALERWLGQIAPEDVLATLIVDVPASAIAALPADAAASSRAIYALDPVVNITADAVRLHGDTLWRAQAPLSALARVVRDRLTAKARQSAHIRTPIFAAVLAISGDARWDTVVAVATGVARAGLPADLAFIVPRRLPPAPPWSPLGDRLAGEPTEELGAFSQELFARCRGAARELARAALPEQRWDAITRGFAAVVRACDCATSPEDVRTWFWHAIVEPARPGFRAVRVDLVSDAMAGTDVAAAADATWASELARVLVPARERKPVFVEAR